MKARISGAAAALVLAAVMVPGVAVAASGDTAVCKNGGWRDLVRDNGTPFRNQGACVSYVAHGGIPRSPERVLAIAYTNLDGDPGFDPGDQLIARVVDLDGNGPDEGDRVEMGRYPTAFSAPFGFAAFGVTSHQVTLQADGDSQRVTVVSGPEEPHTWAHIFVSTPGVDFYSEFNTNQDPKQDRVFIVDSHDTAENDRIEVRGSGGSAPTTPVDPALVRVDAQNDPFFNVDVFMD